MAHSQLRPGPLRIFNDRYDRATAPSSAGSSVEQLLKEEDAGRWSPHNSPSHLSDHELNDDHTGTFTKRSVLARVREKAKKWRHTLGKKKHAEDDNSTPSWGVSLVDEEEEEDEEGDPEYLGAPMYESETAPELYRETARQHPRANPVIPEHHLLPTSNNCTVEPEKGSLKTLNEKLGPAYATLSDATHAIASKLHSLTVSTPDSSAPAPQYQELHGSTALSPVARGSTALSPVARGSAGPSPAARGTSSLSPTARGITSLSPAARSSSSLAEPKLAPVTKPNLRIATRTVDNKAAAPSTGAPSALDHSSSGGMAQMWDKGVSVKEYIMNKFEPGEDEKALSHAISQAMSPRKNPRDPGVVGIVKDAVHSFLGNEEAHPHSVYHSAENLPTHTISISTNAHEVEEETQTHGRILQAN